MAALCSQVARQSRTEIVKSQFGTLLRFHVVK